MTWKGEIMNYEEMSLVELRAAAKKMGLKGTTAMRKSELLALLMNEKDKKQEEKVSISAQLPIIEQKQGFEEKIIVKKAPVSLKEGVEHTYYNKEKENNFKVNSAKESNINNKEGKEGVREGGEKQQRSFQDRKSVV